MELQSYSVIRDIVNRQPGSDMPVLHQLPLRLGSSIAKADGNTGLP